MPAYIGKLLLFQNHVFIPRPTVKVYREALVRRRNVAGLGRKNIDMMLAMANVPEPRYSFTQPICGDCFEKRYPDRFPTRLRWSERELEVCCDCGAETLSGTYVRVDPRAVKHPTRLK